MKHELEQALQDWAAQDDANREELLSDPNGVFEREMGVTLPDGMDVCASDQSDGVAVELPDNVEALWGDDALQLQSGVRAGNLWGGTPILCWWDDL